MISVHSCVRGRISMQLPEEWRFRCIHVWGVRSWLIYLRYNDFDAFMCEGQNVGFTWEVTILVHSCVRDILVHLLEGWWFRCIHVLRVGWRSFSWGATISVHSFVRGRIPVHLLEGWWFQCIHVWEVKIGCIHGRSDDFFAFIMCEGCIYLRDDDFGAFMCEG